MNKSNKRLIVLIALLVVANVWLMLSDGIGSTDHADRLLFTLNDTSQVDQIIIAGSEEPIRIQRAGGQWTLNEDHQVDEGMRRLLLSILQRVSVRKLVDAIPSDSVAVSITGGINKEFLVFSNPTKTRTYFHLPASGQSYEVEIPGYNEYLGGIFELSENQWRDRMVMDENWRSIKSLVLDYEEPDLSDISITFNGQFFVVEGVSAIDSSQVVDYLNQFQVFEVNEIISANKFPVYDSLSRTTPLATLTINSIRSEDPRQLFFFPPIGNAPYQLITNPKGELMVLESNRVNQILSRQEELQSKE